jgi:hypothetical protein
MWVESGLLLCFKKFTKLHIENTEVFILMVLWIDPKISNMRNRAMPPPLIIPF